MKEEIGPKIAKLKEEKTQFVEYKRVERELEHCRRICLAWRYVTALNESQKAEESVQIVRNKIEEKNKTIITGEEELKSIEKEFDEAAKKKDAVCILIGNINIPYIYFFNYFVSFRKQEVN